MYSEETSICHHNNKIFQIEDFKFILNCLAWESVSNWGFYGLHPCTPMRIMLIFVMQNDNLVHCQMPLRVRNLTWPFQELECFFTVLHDHVYEYMNCGKSDIQDYQQGPYPGWTLPYHCPIVARILWTTKKKWSHIKIINFFKEDNRMVGWYP